MTKIPTILQLIPELETGGAERGCVDMARAIRQAGGRAIVISAGGKMVRELEESGAQHLCWPSIKSKNPFKIMWNAAKLQVLLRRGKVDLIHARSRAPAWVGYFAASRTGVPFMTTFHSTYNFKSNVKRWYNSVMARGVRVIAISDFIRQHILANYHTHPENIRLIHRGVDIDAFSPAAVTPQRMAALRSNWGVAEGVPVILLPGRLTRWKGQAVLIEAMALLKDTNAVAVCVGSDQGRTDYTQSLRDQIKRLGLKGRVVLAGDCTDMPAACAAASIVASCSTEPEAFGRVIVEAQAMERPVVVSNLGAVAETAAGGWGMIVPPEDPAALAGALRQVLALTPEARATLGPTARAFVLANYTRAKMTAATLAVYEEILDIKFPGHAFAMKQH